MRPQKLDYVNDLQYISLTDFIDKIQANSIERRFDEVRVAFLHPRHFLAMQEAYNPPMEVGSITKTFKLKHLTIRNLVKALKEQLPLIEFKLKTSRATKIHKVEVRSYEEFGNPDYLLKISGRLHAVINIDDFQLYIKDRLNMALVCLNPERNFMVKL